mgnify:CR=1 FL=1
MKNSEYVCGIPVPNNYNRSKIYSRIRGHSRASSHSDACSHKGTRTAAGVKQGGKNAAVSVVLLLPVPQKTILVVNNQPKEQISSPEIGENEAINIEPTEAEIKNKIDAKTCAQLVKKRDQHSKFKNDEIGVKVEMHDSDDEPLTKIIKLS